MDNLNSALTIKAKELVAPNQNKPIPSKMLFAQGDVVQIQHQNDQYFLRRTRNGKLILTK
ncbi:MAG: hemin uptake protein HemP [Nitrosomonas sp.]|nr:hemin uptake protein HemP [Nitrosomonas sp.]